MIQSSIDDDGLVSRVIVGQDGTVPSATPRQTSLQFSPEVKTVQLLEDPTQIKNSACRIAEVLSAPASAYR